MNQVETEIRHAVCPEYYQYVVYKSYMFNIMQPSILILKRNRWDAHKVQIINLYYGHPY